MANTIQISDDHYKEILREIGYPVVTDQDIELSKDDILDICVRPVLREFFSFFPIKETISHMVNSNFSYDFPDDSTFGILDARLNTSYFGASGRTANPFSNAYLYTVKNIGKYGTINDYGFREAQTMQKLEKTTAVNYTKAFRVDVNESDRKITGYTNITGELIVTWAKESFNFEDVHLSKIKDVIKLSQANLLRTLGMLRGQIDSGTNSNFNYQLFLDRADKLEDEVITRWKNFTKVVIMRG